jgi:stage III sporulation protein AB
MPLKLVGAIVVIVCCGGFGILLARNHRREVALLHELLRALDLMASELEYRLTPLPDLCRACAEDLSPQLRHVFCRIAQQLDLQKVTDVAGAVEEIFSEDKQLPDAVTKQLRLLGQSLGRYDLNGQLRGLRYCSSACQQQLDELERNQQQRLRSYQTLGFCAGAVLAILLV